MTDSSQESSQPRNAAEHLKPYQFQPGQSGNPGGRKKKPITEIYEELLDDPETRALVKQAIRERLLSGRMVGNLELKEATDRLEGKVTQTLEATINVSAAETLRKIRERKAALLNEQPAS